MKEIKLFTTNQSSCCTSETVNDTSCCSSPEMKLVDAPSQMQFNLDLPVAIIGAGPVGLAAAANLAIQKVPFVVFESGQNVAQSIRKWQHVHLFSPWQYDIDKTARKLLEETDWESPQNDVLPTGRELIEQYLEPLSELPVLKESIC